MPRSLKPDKQLLIVTLTLCFIGAVMVFSASAMTAREQFGSSYHFLLRQSIWLVAGLAGMLYLMNVDYRKFRNPPYIFTALFIVLALLAGVFFLDRSHATHRWIRIGPASLQPSEFAKLVVIFYLAWFLELRLQGRGPDVNDWRNSLLPAVAPVVALACLVVFEPDLGTAVQIFIVAFALLFAAGLSWTYVGGAGAFAGCSIVLLIVDTPYRFQRVVAFLNPNADPQGRGFQLMQSLIAVGTGGLTGVGLMESKQKLFYLPEASTDFIFAVICEELGFIGAALVLALFAIYAWRGIRASLRAPDTFGRLVALGITVMVISQALINLGVVLGMMPTKGIPLPFISYGGSSLLVVLLATGVLLNISQHAD